MEGKAHNSMCILILCPPFAKLINLLAHVDRVVPIDNPEHTFLPLSLSWHTLIGNSSHTGGSQVIEQGTSMRGTTKGEA